MLVDIADTEAVVAAVDDAALLWIESPTNPALEVADLAALVAAAHEAGACVVVDNTFATPLLQRPLDLGADIVVHSATKFLAGHSDVVLGAVVTRDDQLTTCSRAGATWSVRSPARSRPGSRCAACAPCPCGSTAPRPTPPSWPGGCRPTRRSSEVRYPASARSSPSCWRTAPNAADLLTHATALWVHATSLGSVESTFERRRRWKAEAATIPEGLVRMSVGIEDVDDLWADLEQALDTLT